MAEGTSKRAREDALIDEAAHRLDPEGGAEARRHVRELVVVLREVQGFYSHRSAIRKSLEDYVAGVRHALGATRAMPELALIALIVADPTNRERDRVDDLPPYRLADMLARCLRAANRALELVPKTGRPVARFERRAASYCYDIFQEWRPGIASSTNKDFRRFVILVLELVDGRRGAEPRAAIRWAARASRPLGNPLA